MISIIIPAFNEEKFLPECLESLKKQDYKGKYEIIVVDNGSTDKTADVARSFGAKVVYCPRKGVVYARQEGVLASRGNIIFQTDADSIPPKNWISKMMKQFSKYPDAVAIAGNIEYINPPHWAKINNIVHLTENMVSSKIVKRSATVRAANFAFKRSAFNEIGGFNEDIPHFGDEHDFFQKLLKVGKVVYADDVFVLTSSRRFQNGPFQYFILDLFIKSFLAYVAYTLSRRIQKWNSLVKNIFLYPVKKPWVSVTIFLLSMFIYGFFVPTADVFGNVYSHGNRHGHLVALTFDDGPNEPYTSQILDILDTYGVKATFFAVGENVKYYPDTSRRIVNEGHEIGLHSYDHSKSENIFNFPQEFNKSQSIIEEVTGVEPRIFRPPFGQKTPWEMEYVKKNGFISVVWDVSPKDPSQPDSKIIIWKVLNKTHPGSIILLHDGKETVHGGNRSQTVDALPKIIEELQKRNYTFVTVAELLNTSPYIN